MFRRLLIILALALLAASCSSSDVLATVNGEEITKSDLYDLRPAYEEDLTGVTGESLREDVSGLIVLTATRQAAERDFGLVIDDAMIADRLTNPPERYAAILAPDLADEGTQRNRAVVTLLIDAVGSALIEQEAGGFAALLADRPGAVTRSCVRHIAVATVEEGNDVLARLEQGEDFVTVAAEVSLDQASPEGLIVGPEGDCLTWLNAVGDEFATLAATAELDVPVGPVASGGGFSVLRVEDRIGPSSAAELAADPMAYLDLGVASTVYSGWASETVRMADVSLTPTLGSWSGVGFGISPPTE